jgi:hypothetical protein
VDECKPLTVGKQSEAAEDAPKAAAPPGIAALLHAASQFANQMGVIHFNCLSDAEVGRCRLNR